MNAAAGGCAAGFIAGVRARSLPLAFGACAAMGTAIGTFSAAGNVRALLLVHGLLSLPSSVFANWTDLSARH